ncbi:MAG: hypothetical protein ACXAC2_13850, partial [Candidatus Kariarchaeaceae archaeon]
MSYDFYFRVFIIPLIALLTPGIMLIWRIRKNHLEVALTRKTFLKFLIVLLGLSFVIFAILLYLTSGILTAFRLEKGFFISDSDITWHATEHLRIIFVYDPGISLLVISILSGLLYAALLTLPKICTIVDERIDENNIKGSAGASTGVSS